MLISDLYQDFLVGYDNKDLSAANTALMGELGKVVVNKRDDFVDLLHQSKIAASTEMTDAQLIDTYLENIDKNEMLQLGSAMLINMQNPQVGFDGDWELSDEGTKAAYHTINCYFCGPIKSSNASGGGGGGGWAEAITESAKLGNIISQGQQKKKFGVLDMATKKQDAKAAMAQQIVAQRQAQIEAKQKEKETAAKTKKVVIIAGVSILALGLVIGGIYMIKKLKK